MKRTFACALVLMASMCGVASASSYFHPTFLYKCTAPQALTGGIAYIDSYQFESGRRYAVGYQHGYKLAGHIQTGRYKLRGNRIVGLSGPLANNHESLLIQKNDLALLDSKGHFTGVGCWISERGYKPPVTPPVKTTIPMGTYSCWHTVKNATEGYSSTYQPSLTPYGDGTYQWGNSIRDVSAWHQSGNNIVFTEGYLWNKYAHDVATYYPSGVSMPNAQPSGSVSAGGYTIVIKDTVQEGETPPSVEWSSTDGPGGTSSTPMSFDYCKR